MKTLIQKISLFFLGMLLLLKVTAQTYWIDSVKHAASNQKEDTNKVHTLIGVCDAAAFSYPDTALKYGQQAYELSEKLDFDNGRLFSIFSMNAAFYSMGNYTQELENAFKLIPLAKRMNSIYATGFSYGTVGDAYANLGEYAAALPYYRKVLQIGIENKVPELHRMYGLLAPVFIGLKQFDSAMIYAKKGYELFKGSNFYTSNDVDMKWSQSMLYTILGKTYASINQQDTAVKYFRMSFPASDWLGMKYNWIDACNGMADIFQQQGETDSALSYAKRILLGADIISFPAGKQKAASLIAAIYEEGHNNDSAIKYLHLAQQIKDSLYNRGKLMAFQKVLLKKNEKDHAVALATTGLQNRYRLYFIIAGFMIAFIIIFMAIRNKRIRQLQIMRNSIADDLHDDIGSTLSSISIMSELAKSKSPEALQLLNSIGASTTAIQENMSDIVWTVNPNNDHFENLLQRMNLFATEITDAKNIQLQFSSDDVLHAVRLTMKQRKNLYLFFKEAINNAVKHAGADEIKVKIDRRDNQVAMRISDNGHGFEVQEQYDGNGMNSLKRRAEELIAVYTITSSFDKGTSITLSFKIT